MHKIEFKEGVKVKDTTKKSKKEHGTILKFSPSKKYLGKTASIPKKELIAWVDSISYFIPKKCKIVLEVFNGLEKLETHKFKNRPISDLLKSHISDELLTPITLLKGSCKLEETAIDTTGKQKVLKRDLDIEFAFSYSDSIEPYVDSFCNYINTTSGGVHLDAVRESIWRYFMKKCQESMSEREKEKYKVLKIDIEQGLNVLVNLSTDMQMQLVGQTKNAVGNDDLFDPIKDIATSQLESYYEQNKDKLATIVKLIKATCKARIDASKIKAATIKEKVNKFDKHKFDKFTPCNNDGKAYKELHICEGDTARNCLVDGRDPDTQAFLSFRGVTANGFKRDASTILDNAEWRMYVTLLKTNFGPKFDISKCYYDKIIIETDADIDGHGITSGIGAFHALYMPELVRAGKLYKSIPPLYRIDDKNHEFVRDKKEYVEIYQDKIIKNYKIILVSLNKKKELSKEDFRQFIYDTQEYSEELVRISKHFGVNKFLVERISAYLIMNYDNIDTNKLFDDNKFVIKFMEMIQKKFPEMSLKGKHSIRGVIDGKFQSININNRFVKKIEGLSEVYLKYGYSVLSKEKKSDKYTEMSIGEFLDDANKFRPKIVTRFKGLGEANSKQLWDTTLNPDTRILIQLTMDDVEKDLKVFEKLHGQSKQNLEDRKAMMSAYKIKREDLDN